MVPCLAVESNFLVFIVGISIAVEAAVVFVVSISAVVVDVVTAVVVVA